MKFIIYHKNSKNRTTITTITTGSGGGTVAIITETTRNTTQTRRGDRPVTDPLKWFQGGNKVRSIPSLDVTTLDSGGEETVDGFIGAI